MSRFTKRLQIKANPQLIEKWNVPKLDPYLKKAKLSKAKWDAICQRCGDCCKLPNGEYCPHFYWVKPDVNLGEKPVIGACRLYPHQEGTILIKKGDPKDWIVCTSIAFVKEISPRCNYRLTFPNKIKKEIKHD